VQLEPTKGEASLDLAIVDLAIFDLAIDVKA